jgi:hypothetical protein
VTVVTVTVITLPDAIRKGFMLSADDKRLIETFRDATQHLSTARAGAAAHISEATARRLRAPGYPSRMSTDVRLALRAFAESLGNGEVRRGQPVSRAETEAPRSVVFRDDAVKVRLPFFGNSASAAELVEHSEAILRQMRREPNFPEDQVLPRHLDALDGLLRHYAARGLPIDWIYQLKTRVTNGDL